MGGGREWKSECAACVGTTRFNPVVTMQSERTFHDPGTCESSSTRAGLASYGSDGSDDDAPIPSSSSKPPTAGPSTLSAVPAVVRIKTTTSAPHSRNHSPLAGVKPLPSSSSSTTNGQGRAGGPSPVKEGKRRESSASPPRYEVLRAPGAGRAEGAEGNNHGESREGSLPGFVGGVQIDSLAAFGVPPLSTGPCNPSVEVSPSFVLPSSNY